MEDKLQKLREIFRDVLDDDSLEIGENFSMAGCEDWDSVATVQIILAVEKSFGVRFTTDEIAGLKSVKDILAKLG